VKLRPPPTTWLALAGIVLMVADNACAEPLGRLFLTPERRATLERQRELNIQETQTLEGSVVSLNGIVTRSSGKHTVWVNQRPQNENTPGTGVTAAVSPTNPGRAVITAGDEPPAALRVGESINRGTRERADSLGGGRVAVSGKH
jgi:hypothetical protein